MKRLLPFAFLVAASGGAFAQSMEPGEWQFESTLTSPMFSQPHTMSVKHCVQEEEARHPERWMARPGAKGDCKSTMSKDGTNGVAWHMSCPKTNTTGDGRATLTGSTMEGEMHVTGESRGQHVEMTSKVHGKRLGPCKS